MTVTTIDIDTGGTFTDGFVVRDGVVHTVKTLTTPHDLAVCFRYVIEAAAAELGVPVADMLRETACVRYATTVGTNTVLQRRGPRLGLLTNSPPADGDGAGIGLFVAPEMVATVPADDASTEGKPELPAIRALLQDGARGLVASAGAGEQTAVERRIATTFAQHYPRHCLDSVPLLLTGEVTADADVVRGRATALFNAYVHPDVADFLYRAEDYLREHGYARPLRVVHNDGGAARVARTIAGKTYNSGPMAGLLGAQSVARHYGIENLVTLDMGGTSLDVGVIRAGEVPMRAHGRVEDVEISFPLPDLVPLGIGGGSIAWLDGSTLRVGPQSAGAQPGPACFGFGGESPTVTDADFVLGVLRPESFAGGGMEISVDAARRSFEPIARNLGCTVEQAAERVLETVHTAAGTRLAVELTERGLAPAAVTALAFGGNGATHSAGIAAAAGIPEVLILPFAPVFSAYGASTVDIRHRHEAPLADTAEQSLRRKVLRDMHGEGVAADDVLLDVREFERAGGTWIAVEGSYALPHVSLAEQRRARTAGTAPPTRDGTVHWPGYGPRETTIAGHDSLDPDVSLAGPALVDSRATTCAVPPGWTFTFDENGAIRLRANTVRSNR